MLGALECADRISSFSLYQKSREIQYIDTRLKNDRKKRLKKYSELTKEGVSDQDTEIHDPNLIDNYYPCRDEALENVSLYEVKRLYEFVGMKPLGKSKKFWPVVKKQVNPRTGKEEEKRYGFFVERKKPIIVYWSKIPKSAGDAANMHYRSLLLLFVPWRCEAELLAGRKSWQEAYEETEEFQVCFLWG